MCVSLSEKETNLLYSSTYFLPDPRPTGLLNTYLRPISSILSSKLYSQSEVLIHNLDEYKRRYE